MSTDPDAAVLARIAGWRAFVGPTPDGEGQAMGIRQVYLAFSDYRERLASLEMRGLVRVWGRGRNRQCRATAKGMARYAERAASARPATLRG